MNYYKRHIGDYIKDTAHLSLLEHGIYTRLMDVYYSREAGIPENQAARLIGAKSKEERAALENVLLEFFELRDGVWINSRCDEEIAISQAKAARNREIGKTGGRPKRLGSNPEPEPEPKENPNGFQKETQTVSKNNPSHKPIAISQESKSGGDPRTKIFEIGKSLLGPTSGGLISKAIAATDEATVFAVLGEMAAKPTADPRAYFVAATRPKRREAVC